LLRMSDEGQGKKTVLIYRQYTCQKKLYVLNGITIWN
jgi:hypothetical protein